MPIIKDNNNVSEKLNRNTNKKNKVKSKNRKTKHNKPKAIKSPLKKRFTFSSYNKLIIKPEIINPSIEFENKYKAYLNNPTNCETDNYIIKLISAYSYVPNIKIIDQYKNNENRSFNNNIKIRERCPVCIENINKNKLVFFKCGHYMCFNCFIKFLNYNYPNCCCPICKEKHIENNITSFYNNYIKEYLFLPDIKTFYVISNINKWLLNSNKNNDNFVYILISNHEKWTNSVSNYIKSNKKLGQNNVKIIFLNYNIFLNKNNGKRSHNFYTSCNNIIENKIIQSGIINSDNIINKATHNPVNNLINVKISLVDPIIKHISTKKKILLSIQNNLKYLKDIKSSLNQPLYKIEDIKQYIIKNTIDEKIFREEVIFL